MQRKSPLYTRLSADPSAKSKLIFSTLYNGYRLHWHYFFEIEFALSGKCTHLLNGAPHDFTGGDICFLTPTSIHQFIPIENQEPVTLYTLSFSSDMLPNEFWQHIPAKNNPATVHLEGEDFIATKKMFESLSDYSGAESLETNFFVKTGIEWIILDLLKKSRLKEDVFSKVHPVINPAIIYLQSNFSSPITLEEVAGVIYFSPEHFSKMFHRLMGVSFQTYLLNLRLDFAAELLALTDLSITSVCEKSGFRTLAYFSRAFKNKFNMPPGAFREIRIKTRQLIPSKKMD